MTSSRKTAALLGGALLLLGLVALFVILAEGDEGRGTAVAVERGPVRPDVRPDPADLATVDRPRPADSEEDAARDPGTVERTAVDAPQEPSEIPADAAWVPGVVVFPPGTPSDDELEVRILTDLGVSEGRTTWWDLDEILADTEEHSAQEFHVVPVAADGGFEVAVPSDTAAWIDLKGRYLYLMEPLIVPVTELPERFELRPRLGGIVAGRVVPPEGTEGVALTGEATLQVFLRDSSWMDLGRNAAMPRLAPIEPDGHFEFRGIPPGDRHSVMAQVEGFAPAVASPLALVEGGRVDTEVPIEVGAILRGIVRDEAGEPVAGAEIRVEVQEEGDGPDFFFGRVDRVKEAESDADGTFVMRGAPAGEVEISAAKEGWIGEDSRSETLVDGQELADIELTLERGDVLTGTVTWKDGSPAADAMVKVRFDADNAAGMNDREKMAARMELRRKTDRTDAQGAFTIEGLEEGPYLVSAVAEEGDRIGSGKLEAVRPDGSALAIVLEPAQAIPGFVRNESGTPVTAFGVEARRKGENAWVSRVLSDEVDRQFESEDGSFRLAGLADGEWSMHVRAEGYARSEPIEFVVPDVLAGGPLEVVLGIESSIAGTVVDPSGAPIPAATVQRAREDGEDRFARMPGLSSPNGTAVTDTQGRFLLEGLGPGPLTLVAQHRGFAASAPLELDLGEGETLRDVVITLSQGGSIEGEIFTPTGEPSGGRMVSIFKPNEGEGKMTTSDASGQFRFDNVVPGKWQVIAMPTEEDMQQEDESNLMSSMKMASVEVVDGETTFVTLGAPPLHPVLLTGRVTVGGQPVESAFVNLLAEGDNVLGNMRMTRTEDGGTFAVELEKPGTYVISVQLNSGDTDGSARFTEIVPEVDEHHIELAMPVGRIEGRVIGPDGEPAASMNISISREGPLDTGSMFGGRGERSTDDDGSYAFDHLEPGTYAVQCAGTSWFSEEGSVGRATRGGIEVREGEVVSGVDFQLEEAGEVRGTVVNGAGQPVGGAEIYARDAAGKLLNRLTHVQTDPEGRFRYNGIAPGEVTFSARTAEAASGESAPVRVVSNGQTEITLRLEPGTMLEVSAVDEERNPVPCRVLVTDAQGRQVNGLAHMEGISASFLEDGFSLSEHRIGPLAPGVYSIRTVLLDGQEKSRKIRLSGKPRKQLKERFKD